MKDNPKLVDFSFVVDEKLADQFKRAAQENGTTAKDILSDFMKDYVVSGGHPEQVVNKWPWNKQG